mgnify:CR=1 FL=1
MQNDHITHLLRSHQNDNLRKKAMLNMRKRGQLSKYQSVALFSELVQKKDLMIQVDKEFVVAKPKGREIVCHDIFVCNNLFSSHTTQVMMRDLEAQKRQLDEVKARRRKLQYL